MFASSPLSGAVGHCFSVAGICLRLCLLQLPAHAPGRQQRVRAAMWRPGYSCRFLTAACLSRGLCGLWGVNQKMGYLSLQLLLLCCLSNKQRKMNYLLFIYCFSIIYKHLQFKLNKLAYANAILFLVISIEISPFYSVDLLFTFALLCHLKIILKFTCIIFGILNKSY